jgi:serine/threonine-protein kinase
MEENKELNESESFEENNDIEDFKNQFKKEENVQKSSGKGIKGFLPYFYVLASFIVVFLLLIYAVDSYVLPSMVHQKEIVSVPEIQGLELEEAIAELDNFNLNYQITSEQYNESYDAETVIKQVPAPNAKVKEGRPVYLTISKGKQQVSAPSLVGLDLRGARIELMQKGLNLGKIDYQNSEDFPKDTIISQSIPSGKEVLLGKEIDVTVSLGSKSMIAVPSLVGLDFEDAVNIITDVGFEVGTVTYRDSQTFLTNTVIETYPNQFEMVPKGTIINMIIAN